MRTKYVILFIFVKFFIKVSEKQINLTQDLSDLCQVSYEQSGIQKNSHKKARKISLNRQVPAHFLSPSESSGSDGSNLISFCLKIFEKETSLVIVFPTGKLGKREVLSYSIKLYSSLISSAQISEFGVSNISGISSNQTSFIRNRKASKLMKPLPIL